MPILPQKSIRRPTVELTCPGLTPCQIFQGGGGSCDDGNPCTADVCVDATCDPLTGAGCCDYSNVPAGSSCLDPGGFPGTCDGAGLCGRSDPVVCLAFG